MSEKPNVPTRRDFFKKLTALFLFGVLPDFNKDSILSKTQEGMPIPLPEAVQYWEKDIRKIIIEFICQGLFSYPTTKDINQLIRRISLLMLSESKGDPLVSVSKTGAFGLLQTLPQLALSYLVEVEPNEFSKYKQMTPYERWQNISYIETLNLIGTERESDHNFWLKVGIWAYMKAFAKYTSILSDENLLSDQKEDIAHHLATICYHCGDQIADHNIDRLIIHQNPIFPAKIKSEPLQDAFRHAELVFSWNTDSRALEAYITNPSVANFLAQALKSQQKIQDGQILIPRIGQE